MKSFASDNYSGVLPEVMDALIAANTLHARSYGADDITARTTALFQDIFQYNAAVHFVFNGTGANVLSLSTGTQSFNSVLCADTSHIYNDESSAPETFTGCRFFPIPANEHGKITPQAVQQRLIRRGDMHYAQTSMLSITQATEYGTVYTIDEIKALADIAHSNGMYFHVDGSRFFNAAAGLGCSLHDISTKVGIDILSLGGTKAGLMFGEAVVVFNENLKKHIAYKQKQAMQLASKTRFIAAQFEALLTNELWRKYAGHANTMAKTLAKNLSAISAISISKPIQANAVFATIPPSWNEPLMSAYPFYVWDEHINEVRLMCSFDTSVEDINAFIQKVATLA